MHSDQRIVLAFGNPPESAIERICHEFNGSNKKLVILPTKVRYDIDACEDYIENMRVQHKENMDLIKMWRSEGAENHYEDIKTTTARIIEIDEIISLLVKDFYKDLLM